MKRADWFKFMIVMLALIVVNALVKEYISEYAPLVVFLIAGVWFSWKLVKLEEA